MSKHEVALFTKTSMTELSGKLADLRYDALSDLLEMLGERIGYDAVTDRLRDRPMLAEALGKAARAINEAAGHVSKAWTIARPKMKEE